jgi:hypothetical protein
MSMSPNGKWSISNITYSVMLLVLTALLGWLLDSTVSLREFAAEGGRFTLEEALAMENRLKRELPPPWLLERIERIERDLDKLESHHH